jgi:hypothetical protein
MFVFAILLLATVYRVDASCTAGSDNCLICSGSDCVACSSDYVLNGGSCALDGNVYFFKKHLIKPIITQLALALAPTRNSATVSLI